MIRASLTLLLAAAITLVAARWVVLDLNPRALRDVREAARSRTVELESLARRTPSPEAGAIPAPTPLAPLEEIDPVAEAVTPRPREDADAAETEPDPTPLPVASQRIDGAGSAALIRRMLALYPSTLDPR